MRLHVHGEINISLRIVNHSRAYAVSNILSFSILFDFTTKCEKMHFGDGAAGANNISFSWNAYIFSARPQKS